MKKLYLKRLLTLLLVTSFLVVPICGCADSTPHLEQKFGVLQQEFLIDGMIKNVGDYTETEEIFLMEFEDSFGVDKYELYDSSELNLDILENRNGKYIIERCIGIVTNSETGDGALLNFANEEYNYISYRRITEEYRDGTIVLSYMVYNPNTNFFDDIIERYDFVICRDYEKGDISL